MVRTVANLGAAAALALTVVVAPLIPDEPFHASGIGLALGAISAGVILLLTIAVWLVGTREPMRLRMAGLVALVTLVIQAAVQLQRAAQALSV